MRLNLFFSLHNQHQCISTEKTEEYELINFPETVKQLTESNQDLILRVKEGQKLIEEFQRGIIQLSQQFPTLTLPWLRREYQKLITAKSHHINTLQTWLIQAKNEIEQNQARIERLTQFKTEAVGASNNLIDEISKSDEILRLKQHTC